MPIYKKRSAISYSLDTVPIRTSLEHKFEIIPQTAENYYNLIVSHINEISNMKHILHHIASIGRVDIFRRCLPLLKKYLDMDSDNGLGTTPLYFAVMHNNLQMAKELVNAGAKISNCHPETFDSMKIRQKTYFSSNSESIRSWWVERDEFEKKLNDNSDIFNINWFSSFREHMCNSYI